DDAQSSRHGVAGGENRGGSVGCGPAQKDHARSGWLYGNSRSGRVGSETSGRELRTMSRSRVQSVLRLSVAWLLLCTAPLWCQATAPQQTPQTPPQTPPAQTENKISPQQAEELFREVDDILKFVSKDTALPVKSEVKRKLISRDEVVAYVTKHMNEDEDARRLRRSEQVLKKFGLLPRDFDLGAFLITLLREQVAGFYDPKTKTVNLLDWLDVEQQRPVMAHELTHALQDQSFGLEKWMKVGDFDMNDKKEPSPADFANDEITTPRQAVVEGQAMAVLVDYTLAPTGQSLINSPQIVEALKQGMLVGTADSVEFKHAPIYMKEALTFPYRYGMDFIAALLTNGG